MEDLDDKYLDDILLLDPEDWLNIPKPLISALSVIKKCLVRQSTFFQLMNKNMRLIDDKIEVRSQNLREMINKTNDNVLGMQASVQDTVDKIEERLNKRLLLTKSEVMSDLDDRVIQINKKFSSTTEQISNANKKIEALPTHTQVEQKIGEATDNLRRKVLHEVEDYYLKPAVRTLDQKIEQLADKTKEYTDKRIKVVNESAHKLKTEISDNIQDTLKDSKMYTDGVHNSLLRKLDDLENQVARANQNTSHIKTEMEKQIQMTNEAIRSESIKTQEEITKNITKIQEVENKLEIKTETIYGMTDKIRASIKRQKDKMKNVFEEIRKLGDIQIAEADAEEPQLNVEEFMADLETKLSSFRAEITEELTSSVSKKVSGVKGEVEQLIGPIQRQLNNSKSLVDNAIVELREKLAWLPLSLNLLEGMNPTEARLFTLEARLRTEENQRHRLQKDFTKLSEVLNVSLTVQRPDSPEESRQAFTSMTARRRLVSRSRKNDEHSEYSNDYLKYALDDTPKTPRLPLVRKT